MAMMMSEFVIQLDMRSSRGEGRREREREVDVSLSRRILAVDEWKEKKRKRKTKCAYSDEEHLETRGEGNVFADRL